VAHVENLVLENSTIKTALFIVLSPKATVVIKATHTLNEKGSEVVMGKSNLGTVQLSVSKQWFVFESGWADARCLHTYRGHMLWANTLTFVAKGNCSWCW